MRQVWLALLRFTDNVFFNKMKVCGNPACSKSVGAIFPTAGSVCVSVFPFGNSHTISNFFIIMFAIMFDEL